MFWTLFCFVIFKLEKNTKKFERYIILIIIVVVFIKASWQYGFLWFSLSLSAISAIAPGKSSGRYQGLLASLYNCI